MCSLFITIVTIMNVVCHSHSNFSNTDYWLLCAVNTQYDTPIARRPCHDITRLLDFLAS